MANDSSLGPFKLAVALMGYALYQAGAIILEREISYYVIRLSVLRTSFKNYHLHPLTCWV